MDPSDLPPYVPFNRNAASTKKVTVLHSPSNPAVKGTTYVVAAVNQLRAEGFQVEFLNIQGANHQTVLNAMSKADIVADQFIVGWYGVFTTESLLLGKPTLVYVR